eukprot:scaffold240737_cov26-Tisochrysis_lutea.AAC.2
MLARVRASPRPRACAYALVAQQHVEDDTEAPDVRFAPVVPNKRASRDEVIGEGGASQGVTVKGGRRRPPPSHASRRHASGSFLMTPLTVRT